MSTGTIRPYIREGAWVSSYSFYFYSAYESRDEFKKTLSLLEAYEQQLRENNKDIGHEHMESFVAHETGVLTRTAYRYATASFLFVCMTIEGLINHYGTVRLGEKFFKINLERVGITEKLSLILLICFGIKVNQNDFIIKETRALFDKRNRLVHPKTRELDFDSLEIYKNAHPRELELDEDISKMEAIIKKLRELDPDICLTN